MSDANLPIHAIQELICAQFNIERMQLVGERRMQSLAKPRQLAYWLAREATSRSLPQIGRAFGGRDHTTIIHGCRQTENRMERDPVFAALAMKLRATLRLREFSAEAFDAWMDGDRSG